MGGRLSESAKHTPRSPATIAVTTSTEGRKERRGDKKRKREDVIDDIFQAGTKKKLTGIVAQDSAIPVAASATPKVEHSNMQFDKGLADVLGAIKEVPKGAALKESRKHKKAK